MKIKAIIASIAAAGTLALPSAAAFADEPVADDILIAPNPEAADDPVADDILIAPNPSASVAEDVYAKAKSFFAAAFKEAFETAKDEIANAGGADAYVTAAMENFTPEYIENVKKELIAMAVESGADEAQLKQSLEPLTAEVVQMFIKDSITLVDSSDSAEAFVDNVLTYSLDFLKTGIEAAGGVDALADKIMAEITDEQLAEIKAALTESGEIAPEELASLTKDSIKEAVKESLTILQSTENVDEIFINALSTLGEEELAAMSALIDESIKALEEQLEDPNKEPDVAPGTGENPHTGVESVAAIVGVIAVAGAVVVISRKKA